MDHEMAKELLDLLIENGSRILRAGFGVDRAESTFFDIIDLIRSNIDLKEYFLARVESTLREREPGQLRVGDVPRELIELAAHELRWPEIGDIAKGRIRAFFHGDASLATSDIAQSISAAYETSWEDREFYSRYLRNQPSR